MTAWASCNEEAISARRWLFGSCALVTLVVGCLDAGPPPRGRHLVTSRVSEQIQLVEGAVGAPRRILLWRTLPAANGFQLPELSTVDDPGPGGGAAETRVIATEIDSPLARCRTPACPTPIDALGRIYLFRASASTSQGAGPSLGNAALVRVDPATGTQRDLGPAQLVQVSSDRARVVFEPPDTVTESPDSAPTVTSYPYVAVDLDDTMTTLPASEASFAGDDLYGLTDDGHLVRLPRDGHTVEDVATDIDGFYVLDTGRGALLVLKRLVTMMSMETAVSSFLDATTRTEETLPQETAQGTQFVFSESGRYAATSRFTLTPMGTPDSGTVTLTIYDRDTGQEMVSTTSQATQPKWRPGRDEVWFDEGADLVRWPVDGQPEVVGHASQQFRFPDMGPSSPQVLATEGDPIFTPDGKFRVFVERFQRAHEVIAVQSADDLSAPLYELNQPNMRIAAIWPLVDGRLIVEDFLTDLKKNDAYIVDPAAQTQRRISSTGNVVATGRDRCLALLHWVASGGSGDLTIVDYATGAETLIAQNVHAVAVDTSADATDALAPGTRVAFLVRNRIASPYDGLWVIELP